MSFAAAGWDRRRWRALLALREDVDLDSALAEVEDAGDQRPDVEDDALPSAVEGNRTAAAGAVRAG